MDKRVSPGEASITELLPKNGLVYSEKANLSEARVEMKYDHRSFLKTEK